MIHRKEYTIYLRLVKLVNQIKDPWSCIFKKYFQCSYGISWSLYNNNIIQIRNLKRLHDAREKEIKGLKSYVVKHPF